MSPWHLRYSELAYTSLKDERTEKGISVQVDITNKGSYDAEEPILVFIRDEVARLPQPVKKLAALGKAILPAGTTETVELGIRKNS